MIPAAKQVKRLNLILLFFIHNYFLMGVVQNILSLMQKGEPELEIFVVAAHYHFL